MREPAQCRRRYLEHSAFVQPVQGGQRAALGYPGGTYQHVDVDVPGHCQDAQQGLLVGVGSRQSHPKLSLHTGWQWHLGARAQAEQSVIGP